MDVELPSRNAFPSCRHQWLKEKAAMDRLRAGEGDDDVQHLWIHRGKLYDLRPYVETHPGGRGELDVCGNDLVAGRSGLDPNDSDRPGLGDSSPF